MTERECCTTCRFCIGQSCHRHAPVYESNSMYPKWPVIIDTYRHWCGDYEKRLEEQE